MHPMNNSIDDKAKNEVRELLQELVVSPVLKELGEKTTNFKEEFSKLKEVQDKLNSLSGQIEDNEDIINSINADTENIDEKLDSLERVCNNCEKICKIVKEKTAKLDDMLENKSSKVFEDHKQNRTYLLALISLSIINMLGLIGLIAILVIHYL